MKNKIAELNNLYQPALENIEQIRRRLGSNRIDHALVFLNNHHIKIENEIQSIQYPIPTIICKLNGIKTKIGFDLATTADYIGFIKFTLRKEDLLSFDFEALKSFRIGIYGFYYYEELIDFKDLEKIKLNAINSGESKLYIKIRISSVKQIIDIIDKMAKKTITNPQKRFSMSSYTCDCEQKITIETYYGQCPICGKDGPNKRKFETTCSICGQPCLQDQYGNGECENCGWIFSKDEVEYEKDLGISYPMLVSPTTAREQYKKGLPFKATLEEFVNGLYFYSEVEFWYKGLNCCVFLSGDTNTKIEFGWSPDNVYYFIDKDDFIQNAKIGDEYIKDIWDKVENPKYL